MKTVVGFSFTDNPVHHLTLAGFSFTGQDHPAWGYREFLCAFASKEGTGHGIELREVLDEEIYFRHQGKRSFSPFEFENPAAVHGAECANTVFCVAALLGPEMEAGLLKDYLAIRKKYPIWALWLRCRDFEKMNQRVQPEKTFSYRGQPGSLLHLGQSCFDLFITA